MPVVVHCGSGPVAGEFTGPGPISEVVARNPNLQLIIAHMGAPEYSEFLALAGKYAGVRLDTTMAFTTFMNELAEFPTGLLPRLLDAGLSGDVLFGSDFPNIPYPTARQSMRFSGSALVMPGCDQCCTPTPPNCSVCTHSIGRNNPKVIPADAGVSVFPGIR